MENYIKKFGEDAMILMVNEDLNRLSTALWSYRNTRINEPDRNYDRTPCCLDQDIGKVIYNLRLLEHILVKRHKYASVDIQHAIKRWEDHSKSFDVESDLAQARGEG